MMWSVISFIVGIVIGSFGAMFIIANDNSLAKINEDEVIIKRPDPNLILVQVTPEIARRLINDSGELIPPNPSEARAMYPERSMHSATLQRK